MNLLKVKGPNNVRIISNVWLDHLLAQNFWKNLGKDIVTIIISNVTVVHLIQLCAREESDNLNHFCDNLNDNIFHPTFLKTFTKL